MKSTKVPCGVLNAIFNHYGSVEGFWWKIIATLASLPFVSYGVLFGLVFFMVLGWCSSNMLVPVNGNSGKDNLGSDYIVTARLVYHAPFPVLCMDV
jgi:hypothetical protein